jgi:hypothetical protein
MLALANEGGDVRQIAVTVNGARREAEVEPRQLLVYYLREQRGVWAYYTIDPEAAARLGALADLKGERR